MNQITLNSYAKLNLYLEVINRRQDNYHNIKTIFERISLSDTIVLKVRTDGKIKIISRSNDIPKDDSNLAFRSAKLLQDSLRVKQGVEIKIIKRIPVGAGLGGGSSNAATVLLGLNKLWGLGLSQNKLLGFARGIGSDVAFFIYKIPFALAGAKGDEIKPLKKLQAARFWHILAVPKIKVSTPMIYNAWDKMAKKRKKSEIHRLTPAPISRDGINKLVRGLTKPGSNVTILTSALLKKNYSLIARGLFNNLEPVTARIYPELKRIRKKFSLLGQKAILMSGSGPAVFSITSSRKEAVSIFQQLKKKARWKVYLVRTV